MEYYVSQAPRACVSSKETVKSQSGQSGQSGNITGKQEKPDANFGCVFTHVCFLETIPGR